MMGEIDWSFVIWTAAVFLSGFLLGRRKRADLAPPPDFEIGSLSPAVRVQIEDALKRNAKIEPIRLLREDSGLGLKDSKYVIDHWDQSQRGPVR